MSHDEPYIRYDEDKFFDVVHYICELFAGAPDKLGQVKLHKILYFSDMTAFYERGVPLTGAEYRRQPFGPTALMLGKALRVLEQEGRIEVGKAKVFGYTKAHFRVLKPLTSNRLSPEDKELIKAVSDWASGLTAVEISDISHQDPWLSVRQGERIDYITAGWLFPRKGPSEADLAWAADAARKLQGGEAYVRDRD